MLRWHSSGASSQTWTHNEPPSKRGLQPYSSRDPNRTRSCRQQPPPESDDSSGNLFVANDPPLTAAAGSVTVYATGTGHLLRTITKGIDKPTALAFDRSGNLYVANAHGLELGSVTVYAPGKSTPAHTITAYVQGPVALGLDPY